MARGFMGSPPIWGCPGNPYQNEGDSSVGDFLMQHNKIDAFKSPYEYNTSVWGASAHVTRPNFNWQPQPVESPIIKPHTNSIFHQEPHDTYRPLSWHEKPEQRSNAPSVSFPSFIRPNSDPHGLYSETKPSVKRPEESTTEKPFRIRHYDDFERPVRAYKSPYAYGIDSSTKTGSLPSFAPISSERTSRPSPFVGRTSRPSPFVGRTSRPSPFVGRTSRPSPFVGDTSFKDEDDDDFSHFGPGGMGEEEMAEMFQMMIMFEIAWGEDSASAALEGYDPEPNMDESRRGENKAFWYRKPAHWFREQLEASFTLRIYICKGTTLFIIFVSAQWFDKNADRPEGTTLHELESLHPPPRYNSVFFDCQFQRQHQDPPDTCTGPIFINDNFCSYSEPAFVAHDWSMMIALVTDGAKVTNFRLLD